MLLRRRSVSRRPVRDAGIRVSFYSCLLYILSSNLARFAWCYPGDAASTDAPCAALVFLFCFFPFQFVAVFFSSFLLICNVSHGATPATQLQQTPRARRCMRNINEIAISIPSAFEITRTNTNAYDTKADAAGRSGCCFLQQARVCRAKGPRARYVIGGRGKGARRLVECACCDSFNPQRKGRLLKIVKAGLRAHKNKHVQWLIFRGGRQSDKRENRGEKKSLTGSRTRAERTSVERVVLYTGRTHLHWDKKRLHEPILFYFLAWIYPLPANYNVWSMI